MSALLTHLFSRMQPGRPNALPNLPGYNTKNPRNPTPIASLPGYSPNSAPQGTLLSGANAVLQRKTLLGG